MRIAIAGAHGIGKSFLANQLVEQCGYPLLTGVAGKVANVMGVKTIKDMEDESIETKMAYQSLVYWEMKELELEHQSFVADRSLYDVIAYMVWYGIPAHVGMFYHELAESQPYDLIIHCPIPDGFAPPEVRNGYKGNSRHELFNGILEVLLRRSQRDKQILWLPKERDQWLSISMNAIKDMLN
ncbi:AAA family ATPase [Acetonema longum]|nr:AAA family ATPase [Acetonema longum]